MVAVALVFTIAACSPPGPPAPTATTQPPAIPAGVSCSSLVGDGRQVRFGRNGSTDLGGLVYGTGRSGVVLAHQSGGDLCMWLDYGKMLAQRGYRVLLFDFPGVASSSGATMRIDEAAVAAADFVRADGASQVVLIGASMGGTAVVAAAAQVTPPIAGVISLSAPSTYAGVNAADQARNLAVPVLYAVAEDDPQFVGSARAMFDNTPASVPRKLVVVPVGGHGVRLVQGGDGGPVGKDVDAFLQQYAPSA